MARENLHKAKSKNTGEWVEGYLYIRRDGVHEINFYHNELKIERYMHEVDADTVCLYTGKTDKEGNKIWEHDVLRDTEDDMILVVRWDEEELRFVLDDYGYKGCLMEYGWDEMAGDFGIVDTYGFNDFSSPFEKCCVVIGNKCDNPDVYNLLNK